VITHMHPESRSIHTNRTGSLDLDVAVAGLTTFMVRPWKVVQLAVGGENIISSHSPRLQV